MKIAIRRWKDLGIWTEGDASTPESSHPLALLDDLLLPRVEPLKLKLDLNGWSPITIHFDGSVERRERQTPFKGAMFAAYPGDVVYSKIDVRNGAICLIPRTLPQVVLTSEFPVHVPDHKQVDPSFLTFILRTPEFLRALKQAASGTSGRKRVSAEAFRSIQIPCPDEPDQRRLMKVYSAELKRAVDLERRSVEVKQTAQRDFETALGIKPPADLPRRTYQLTSFSAIDRWSHEAILARSINAMSSSEFPLVSLGDVIADLENGWSPRCENRPAKEGEWGVLKLGAVSFGTYEENENKCLPVRLKAKPQHEIRAGDVLVSRANILRLVGACAIVHSTRPRLMLCDKIFRVLFNTPSAIEPEFLSEVLKVSSVRQQIETEATGTSPTMKNISKPALMQLTFPLPDMPQQNELVRDLRLSYEKVATLENDARTIRVAARENLINAVFS